MYSKPEKFQFLIVFYLAGTNCSPELCTNHSIHSLPPRFNPRNFRPVASRCIDRDISVLVREHRNFENNMQGNWCYNIQPSQTLTVYLFRRNPHFKHSSQKLCNSISTECIPYPLWKDSYSPKILRLARIIPLLSRDRLLVFLVDVSNAFSRSQYRIHCRFLLQFSTPCESTSKPVS